MKKVIIVFFVVLMLSACGSKQEKVEVVVIGKSQDSFWNDVKLGAESAGRDFGVKVSFFAPKDEDPAWQIRKIEEIIAKPIDGIAFAASDPKSIAPTISKAMDLNIPCIALDTDVAKSRHAYIGTGNYFAGQQAGEAMLELLDGKGKVAIITDQVTNADYLKRIQGFRDILAEYKDVQIVVSLEKENGSIKPAEIESMMGLGDGKTTGKPVAPDLNGVFCVSDSSGIVSAEVVKKSGKVGKIRIVCIGESPEIMNMVNENVIQSAISRRSYRTGYLSVMVLYNMAKAGISSTLMMLPKSEIIDPGTVIVTPQNITQYREQIRSLGIKTRF